MSRTARIITNALVTLMLLLLPAGLAAGQQHELTMDRYRPVGSKFNVQLKGEQTSRQTQVVNGKRAGSASSKIVGSFTGVVEILAIHESKETKSIAVKVEKFDGERNGVAIELDTSKRILASGADGEMTLTYEDGSALPEQATELMDLLITFMVEERPSEVRDDQKFRLQQPREVGSSWQCDNKLIADDLSAAGKMKIDPDKLDSEFKFLDVVDLNGEKAAQFELNVEIKELDIPAITQQGMTITQSGGTLQMAGRLPLNKDSNNGAAKMTMGFNFAATVNADGAEVKITTDINASADAVYTEIK